ncbi:MAG: hypothetical protein ACI35T_02230 [Alistipes sp.]
MSLLDDEETLMSDSMAAMINYVNDKKSLEKFQNEVLKPNIKRLQQGTLSDKFAVGVYTPNDFDWNSETLLYDLCHAQGVPFLHFDCGPQTSGNYLSHLLQFVETVTCSPFSVILLKNFDKIPDNIRLEKEYIENIFIRSWESNLLTCRQRFFVVFETSEDYGDETPAQLKKIAGLEWYGSIRKEIIKDLSELSQSELSRLCNQ